MIKKIVVSVRDWIVIRYSLRGSWNWAKQEMKDGKIVQRKNDTRKFKMFDFGTSESVLYTRWRLFSTKDNVDIKTNNDVWVSPKKDVGIFTKDHDATDWEVIDIDRP